MDTFDLLVGADGLHSNTRTLLFNGEASFVHDMGYFLATYSVPDYLGLKDQGGRCGMWADSGRFGVSQAAVEKIGTASPFRSSTVAKDPRFTCY